MLGKLLRDLLRGEWRSPKPVAAPSAAAPVTMRYRPDVFDVADESAARGIILTPEGGVSTQERWERETPYLARLIEDALRPGPSTRVIDYGCGIGRLSRALIASTGCRVVGVDISASMRRLAVDHVASPSFEAIDPATLAQRTAAGSRADAAIACWVLQHCMDPARDIAILHDALRPGAKLAIVNNSQRAVPSDRGWVNDGVDIASLLDQRFRCVVRRALDGAVVGDEVARHAYLAVYERP